MTNSSYLQRLIARMGIPSPDAAPPLTSPLTPAEAPTPPVYDPFAEAEMSDTTSDVVSDTVSVPPATIEPLATDRSHRHSFPSFRERGGPLPPPERETAIEMISPPPEHIVAEPPLAVKGLERGADILPPQPPPKSGERSAPPPGAEPVERLVYETSERPVADLPQPEPPSVFWEGNEPPPPLETMEQVRYEFIEPPGAEAPPSPIEPAIEPDAPTVAPILAPPAPQITIGDIVVEIVTKSEMPGRVPSMPASRAARPLEASALRAGVRSKRGFGLGQV